MQAWTFLWMLSVYKRDSLWISVFQQFLLSLTRTVSEVILICSLGPWLCLAEFLSLGWYEPYQDGCTFHLSPIFLFYILEHIALQGMYSVIWFTLNRVNLWLFLLLEKYKGTATQILFQSLQWLCYRRWGRMKYYNSITILSLEKSVVKLPVRNLMEVVFIVTWYSAVGVSARTQFLCLQLVFEIGILTFSIPFNYSEWKKDSENDVSEKEVPFWVHLRHENPCFGAALWWKRI